MQLGAECPDSTNNTIATLSQSLGLDKLWYGAVIGLTLEKTGRVKKYTNVEYQHLGLFMRFFRGSTSPCMVY